MQTIAPYYENHAEFDLTRIRLELLMREALELVIAMQQVL